MKKLLLSLALCLQLVSNGLAQQPGPPPSAQKPAGQKPAGQKPATPVDEPAEVDVVKITTNLVQVDAVVKDKKGKHVTDLRAEEVEMFEDGKPQAITNFGYVNISRPSDSAKAEPAKQANGPTGDRGP